MKRIFLITLIGILAFVLSPLGAKADQGASPSFKTKGFSEDLKETCNRVMLAIFQDILSRKGDYDNLVNFGEWALSKNQYGIHSIEYGREILYGVRKGEFLRFGVTIVRPEDTNFSKYGREAFNFVFPLLNVKFSGYQQTNRQWLKFDIQDIVRQNGDPLLEEQQKYLPLQLSLVTDKEVYRVGEKIQVTVTLKNVSEKSLWVNSLSDRNLYFLYGNTKWGAAELRSRSGKKERFVLEPGLTVSRTFVGSGLEVPQELEIYCSYLLTFEGVKPFSIIRVKVVE
jgi:hypothetical protein